jgi:multidrug efflux pump subunit AcrA (membrane-fusion protein)
MKYISEQLIAEYIALIQRRKRIAAPLGFFIVVALLLLLVPRTSDQDASGIKADVSVTEVPVYSTISPEMVNSASSVVLLGTVLSNETANIYPRRDGIVEDVFVDIGDEVSKNQVVALLLPKGVEGQSAAMISEKQARRALAVSNLTTAENVAEEMIIGTRQKISDKEIELQIAHIEQVSLLTRFADAQSQVSQMQEQTFSTIQNVYQLVEWMLLGSNSRAGATTRNDDILRNLGLQDASNASRYHVVDIFNTVSEKQDEYSSAQDYKKVLLIEPLILSALELLSSATTLLQATPSESNANGYDHLTHAHLTDRLNKLVAAQDMLYRSKEKLEDAKNAFNTLTSSEPELYLSYRSGDTSDSKSNKVLMLEEAIRSSYNALGLTEANQDQIVERQKSQVQIANSLLQLEHANSGHQEIRSPFAGVVSKRFVDVGQIVMPSMPAYELTGVPTTLALKAKAEVRFGLPENLVSSVDVGDSIDFLLQSDDTTTYSAVVTRKSPQVDMQTHTVIVQAKIPDNLSLPHQSSVRIRLTDEKKPVFRVPSSTVKRDGDSNFVWILDLDSQSPKKQNVSVTAEDGEFAEITGNVTSGSLLITDSPALFND